MHSDSTEHQKNLNNTLGNFRIAVNTDVHANF